MERGWKQLLAAFLLGALMPSLMLRVTGRMGKDSLASEETKPTQQQVITQGTGTKHSIPVLQDSGSIHLMELETYIFGVVLAEMPASFEEEALKAQAIVARTYALRRLERGDRHGSCAVCTEPTCCQAFITEEYYLASMGSQRDMEKIRNAVEATAGIVLTYGGELAEATYFSCSGGRTEDAWAVWGEEYPYLVAVDSPGEENAATYSEAVHFTREQFCALLDRNFTGDPKEWIGRATLTQGNGVALQFIGGIGYSGTHLRKLLGLNSTAFTMVAEGDGITVITKGKGHRVGMSQYGADAMAAAGSDHREILSYYYPGTEIDNYSEME